MAGTITKRQVRTDAAGYYVEFTYDDGHKETQPAGRPQTKEDLQRLVRKQLALNQSLLTMQAEATRASFIANDPNASNSRSRDVYNQTSGLAATADFSLAISAGAKLAQTASVRPVSAKALVDDVALGGPATNEDSEFVSSDTGIIDESTVTAFQAVLRTPPSDVREISNG